MKATDKEIAAIQKHFPDLYLNKERSRILGEISFHAHYDGKQLYLNPSKQNGDDIFHGYYEIEVCLNKLNSYGLPIVNETGGKIFKFSHENNMPPADLDLNGDGSCCLGIFTREESANITLDKYILEIVFSFFAGQAFFSTYKEKPPWGEYSHGIRGEAQKNIEIFKNMKNTGRNDPCPCGSGLKYKKCCIDQFQHFNWRVK